MQNVRLNPNRLAYAYFPTPNRLTGEAKLTRLFSKRKMAEIEALQKAIDMLSHETGGTEVRAQVG